MLASQFPQTICVPPPEERGAVSSLPGGRVADVGCLRSIMFFFFQAEDGIRDWSVTGVQTCALPICLAIFDFIEGWYNPRRRHSALDYRSPMIYERSRGTSDRTVPSGSTIDTVGAISVPPSARVQ